MDMSKIVAKRIKMERAIISRLVKDGLKLGYVVSVCDGEEWTVKKSTSYKAIMGAIQTTDEDIIRFRKADGELVGSFYMVYGNDGYDVISDYSDNDLCKELIKGADTLSDKYQQ
jgi:hypothetical protein